MKKVTKEKIALFLEVQKENGTLAPYFKRYFFINDHLFTDKMETKNFAIRTYVFMHTILYNFSYYENIVPKKSQHTKQEIENKIKKAELVISNKNPNQSDYSDNSDDSEDFCCDKTKNKKLKPKSKID